MSTIASFPTATRVHIALDVHDVEASLPFYAALFAQGPTKVRDGYAKFEVIDPAVHLSLNRSTARRHPDSVAHFGIQMKSRDEVRRQRDRVLAAGMRVREEREIICCYSVQDKFWITDPDGHEWEFFVVLEDSEVYCEPAKQASLDAPGVADQAAACCAGAAPSKAAEPSCCAPAAAGDG